MGKKKMQRVSYLDAIEMLEKTIYKNRNSTTYESDAAGGNEEFYNACLVKKFIKKITR